MASTNSAIQYDIKSSKSIFEYSKGLLGKTLRDFVWENYEPKKGKGCFTHPDATNDQQKHLEILLPCTIRNYPNRMNCQIDSSWSHISTNEWYGEYLLSSECTLVHCLGRSSTLRASAPS